MTPRRSTTNPEQDSAPESAADTSAAGDGGAAELQARFDEAHAKGYFGTTPDPIPNERYSLATGPESPSAAEALAAVTTPSKES